VAWLNGEEELVRVLEEAFTGFRRRFDQIEDRLARMEQRGNTLLRETQVVEEPKLLGGRSIGTSAAGIERFVRVPACDVCGDGIKLGEGFSACPRCRRKCCKNDKCLVSFNAIHLCSICLRETLPLSRKEYKALLALSQKVVKIKTISNLSGIKKSEVRSIIDQLRNRNLVIQHGIIPFSINKVVEEGFVALTAYRPVYGEDSDMATYELELQSHTQASHEVVEA
jgi:hypothetical protein